MNKNRCNIGVITKYSENFYFGSLLKGIQNSIRQEGGRLFIFNTYMLDRFKAEVKGTEDYYSFTFNHIDGWIIISIGGNEEYLEKVYSSGKPQVIIGHRSEYNNCTVVLDDSYNGAVQVVEHLLSHGHKRIAYVGVNFVYDMVQRHAGYKETLDKYGFYDESIVYDVSNPMPENGKEVALNMLKKGIDFTAIFAANDYLAIGLIEGLKEGNVRVPQDMAVIGYDNSDKSKSSIPPLSSVNQRTYEIGEEAGRTVIRLVRGEKLEPAIYVKSSLIVRESCGCIYKPDSENENITIDLIQQKNNMIEKLEDVLYKNSDLGTKLFTLSISDIIKLIPQITDEYSWFCFGLFEDDKESENKIITQTVVDNIKKTKTDTDFECPLENFPPIELVPDYKLGENDVIFIVPVSSEKKNIGIMAYITQIHYETKLFVYDMHVLMYNLLGIAIDRNLVMSNLKETLESLKKTQTQLIESEKLASLGHLVSGIAHDINKPISEGVAAATSIRCDISDLKELFEENRLTKTDLITCLRKNNKSFEMLLENLLKASGLIKSFKKIAIDNTIDETRVFKLKDLIYDVKLSLDTKLRQYPININLNCPDNLYLNCNPGDLIQVFTNLIMNSIIHGYDEGMSGIISIYTILTRKDLVLEYTDDGKGMGKEVSDHIFEPFFTAEKSNHGLGLGLYTINNIIQQKLGGIIECDIKSVKGTKFKITLPLSLIADRKE